MKKLRHILGIAVLSCFLFAGSALADGVCLDYDGACNDMYLSMGTGDGVIPVHGYEYGCGYDDRITTGTIVVAGSYAYVGLTGSTGTSGAGDYGNTSNNNYVVSLSSMSGNGYYQYIYMSSGSVAGHGGGPIFTTAFMCAPQAPEAVEVIGVDNAIN